MLLHAPRLQHNADLLFAGSPSLPCRDLVGDPPALEPLQVAPLLAGSDHTKRNRPEQPVETNDDHVQHGENAPADLVVELPCSEVKTETHCQNGEP